MAETTCFDCSHPVALHTARDGCTALDYLDGSTKGLACLCWFTPEWAATRAPRTGGDDGDE